jgi:hypothetical protein
MAFPSKSFSSARLNKRLTVLCSMKLDKDVVQRRIDLMTDEGIVCIFLSASSFQFA